MVTATRWRGHAFTTVCSLGMLSAIVGCRPDIEGRPSLIDSPRVIAIRSEAPEANPDESVNFDVLLARPIDDTSVARFDWALCNERKPLAESGPIATSCLKPTGTELLDLGGTTSAVAQMPRDVCQIFGPITPTPNPGEPTVRAADPDTTGGYYQPVRLWTRYANGEEQYEVGVTRISCGIALGASQENTVEYRKKYRPNSNPEFQSVTIVPSEGSKVDIDPVLGASPLSVHPGEKLELIATWATCLEQAGEAPCTGAEAYLSYDTVAQSLADRRESIRVSWYATGGSYEHDRTGRTEAEVGISDTLNTWTAPETASRVRFWLVIRDDRRGVSWTQFDLDVVK